MSTAKLVLDGKEHELPVVVGSEGEVGIDISKLRAKSDVHVPLRVVEDIDGGSALELKVAATRRP